MIKKLYDFRQVEIPAPLLQAEVTRQELDAELFRAAARFTDIVAVEGPIQNGDVVKRSFADPKAPGESCQVYANVGKDFDDMEARLPGVNVGEQVMIPYAGREVGATVLSVKRLQVPQLTDAYVVRLGIENVQDVPQLEEHLSASWRKASGSGNSAASWALFPRPFWRKRNLKTWKAIPGMRLCTNI